MILLWAILIATPWHDYWSCLEPCYDGFEVCVKPCGETYRACQSACEAVYDQRQRLATVADFCACATGPADGWTICRWVPYPVCDPWDLYPDWLEACEPGIPMRCERSDVDDDGHVDLQDYAVLTRKERG